MRVGVGWVVESSVPSGLNDLALLPGARRRASAERHYHSTTHDRITFIIYRICTRVLRV